MDVTLPERWFLLLVATIFEKERIPELMGGGDSSRAKHPRQKIAGCLFWYLFYQKDLTFISRKSVNLRWGHGSILSSGWIPAPVLIKKFGCAASLQYTWVPKVWVPLIGMLLSVYGKPRYWLWCVDCEVSANSLDGSWQIPQLCHTPWIQDHPLRTSMCIHYLPH